MKLTKDYVRRFAGLFWAISACFFLWIMNHIKTQPFSFESFVWFSFMLIGGSTSYHFLVELLTTPYHDENSHLWKKLAGTMFSLMSILFLTCGLILIDKFIWPRDGLLALVSLFIGYCGLWYLSSRVNCLFKSLRTNPQLQNEKIETDIEVDDYRNKLTV